MDIDCMQHPLWRKIVTWMYADQGTSITDLPEDYIVAEEGSNDFELAEKFLNTLSEEELETLAIGDQDDWPPILGKTTPEIADATHRVLDAIFIGIGA